MSRLIVLLLVVVLAGCATQAQFLDGKQGLAMPVLQGPLLNGIQRAEYTVGVAGCGKRTAFVVVCPDEGDGCFATGPGRFLRE